MSASSRAMPRAVLVDPGVWPQVEAMCRRSGITLELVPAGPSQAPRYTMSRRARRLPRSGDGLLVAPPRNGLLTDREAQVLLGMSEGLSNGEIGRELYLSEDTIKSHCRKVFRKLGARDRAHAVAIGYRAGLLDGGAA